jgi:copper(I)-binding protein
MVSRRSTGPLRTLLPAVAVGVISLVVAGCSAGQVTQTDQMQPAVNGNKGDVGNVALRDVVVAYPESGSYDAGDDAPLTLTIVNVGGTDDELTAVSSPAAEEVELLGDVSLPGRAALQVVVPDESTPSSASSATSPETTESSLPEESVTEPSAPAATGSRNPDVSSEAPESTPEVTGTEVAPQEVGTLSIVLTGLTADLPIGRNVPVTFVFAEAGEITLNLPIGAPATARPEATDSHEE